MQSRARSAGILGGFALIDLAMSGRINEHGSGGGAVGEGDGSDCVAANLAKTVATKTRPLHLIVGSGGGRYNEQGHEK
jgi:hypothetical protein